MSATDDLLAQLLGRNSDLFTAYEAWSNAQIMLLAGKIDDPDSFNAAGGKTGALGYYPVQNVNGVTIYVPCIARLQAMAVGATDPAALETLLSRQVNAAADQVALAAGHATQAAAKAAAAEASAEQAAQAQANPIFTGFAQIGGGAKIGDVSLTPAAAPSASRALTDEWGNVFAEWGTDGSLQLSAAAVKALTVKALTAETLAVESISPAKVLTALIAIGSTLTSEADATLPAGTAKVLRDVYGNVFAEIMTDGTMRFVSVYAKAFATELVSGSIAIPPGSTFSQAGVTVSTDPAALAAKVKLDPYGFVFYEEGFDGKVSASGVGAGSTAISTGVVVPSYIAGLTSQNAWSNDPKIVYIIPIMGQSNAVGVNKDIATDPLVAGTARYPTQARMPAAGLRVSGVAFSSLVPLVETGDTTALSGESLASGMVNHLIATVASNTGITPTIVTYISARSAQSIQNLGRGSPYYTNHLLALKNICDIVRADGKIPVVLGTVWVQGEADAARTIEEHTASVRALARQNDADCRQITGQSEQVLLFTTQITATARIPTATNFNEGGAAIALAELNGEHLLRCSGPMYQFPISSDNLHLANLGQNRHGQMHARAIFAEWGGLGHVPIYFKRGRWVANNIYEAEFGTCGFDLTNDTSGATVTPTSVSQAGLFAVVLGVSVPFTVTVPERTDSVVVANKARLTFDSPVVNSIRLYGAQTPDGIGNGPIVGGRSTIRDTSADVSIYDPSHTEYNWMLAFTADIGRP